MGCKAGNLIELSSSTIGSLGAKTMRSSATKLKLSGSGMANLALSKSGNDFTFSVGQHSYKCPWFVADFLSPRIGRLHSTDPTLNEFVIQTEDPEHQFEQFLLIGAGGSINVNESSSDFFGSVASELGNFELYCSVHDRFKTNDTVSTIIERFRDCDFANISSMETIEFVAVHFLEFEPWFLKELPVSVLSQILQHPSLTLRNEDCLLDFLISQIESNRSFVELLEFVQFEFLT
jgi:hypothetical protein